MANPENLGVAGGRNRGFVEAILPRGWAIQVFQFSALITIDILEVVLASNTGQRGVAPVATIALL